jgi:hypothetical protein
MTIQILNIEEVNELLNITATDGFLTIKCSGNMFFDTDHFGEHEFNDWIGMADAGWEGFEFVM